MREKRVGEELIETLLDKHAPQWYENAEQVRAKRFGNPQPENYEEKARQMRFLQYRGFTSDQVQAAMPDASYNQPTGI